MWWILLLATAFAGWVCTYAAGQRGDAQSRQYGQILLYASLGLLVARLLLNLLGVNI